MRNTGLWFMLLAVLAMPACFAGCGGSPPPTNTSSGHDDHDHGDHEGEGHEGHDHDGDGHADHDAEDHD